MARKTLKTEAAVAAHKILASSGRVKRVVLQKFMGAALGREVGDDEFEIAISSLRIIRVRGAGGFIALA